MTSRLLILFIGLSLSAAARADASEFSSYDECILESLKGVSSDVAANAIIESCRNTFPEAAAVAPASAEPAPEPPAESVPVEEPEPAAKPTVAAAGEPR